MLASSAAKAGAPELNKLNYAPTKKPSHGLLEASHGQTAKRDKKHGVENG